MAEQFPPTPGQGSGAALAGRIVKGATVHDAVGIALGNVTDVEPERQQITVDGRPVGYNAFTVPLSAVSEVTGNEVHLNVMIDQSTPPDGSLPRFVAPPADARTRSSPTTPERPAAETPFATETSATSASTTPPTAAYGASDASAGYQTTEFGGTFKLGTAESRADTHTGSRQGTRAPIWHEQPQGDEGDGMSTLMKVGAASLTLAGLAAGGYLWWQKRRKRSTFERAMDLATDSFDLVADFLTERRLAGYPAWWAAAATTAASALPLLYYAWPKGTTATDQASGWFDGAQSASRSQARRQMDTFERLAAMAPELRAADLLDLVSDHMPSSLPAFDDLFADARESKIATLGIPAAVLVAGAAVFAATRAFGRKERTKLVSDVMTHRPQVIRPDASVSEAAAVMQRLDVGAVPICDGGRLIGMLTDRDIALRLAAEGRDPHLTRVADIMSPDATWASADDPVEEAARIMRQHQIRRLPIVDERHNLVGIVSLGDLATDVHDVRLSGETLEDVSEPTGPHQSRL